ncbi:MAG: hypothetical protein KDK66_01440 [Deltaproteobacteria bacterium]|nr:hypothetical protein [Deltaproteobacteria bacterium]
MPHPLGPLKSSNFEEHLKASSRLLKNALNREALDTSFPWNQLLNYVSKILEMDSGFISINDKDPKNYFKIIDPVAITWPKEGVDAFFEANWIDDFHNRKALVKLYQRIGHSSTTEQVANLKSFRKTAFYNEFCRPYEVPNTLAIGFSLNKNQWGILSFYKPGVDFKVHALMRRFCSDLSEDLAMALSHRILLKKLLATQGSLDRLQWGLILLDEMGFVQACNKRAEEILRLGDPLLIKHKKLVTTDMAHTEKLNDLCQRTLRGESRQRENQILIKSSSGNPPLQIIVASLDHQISDSLLGGYVPTALFINWPYFQESIPVDIDEIFREFYGCGPKQAQVATLFSQGLSESEIAKKMDIAKNTVRGHLATVREKLKNFHQKTSSHKRLFPDISNRHQFLLRPDQDLRKNKLKI